MSNLFQKQVTEVVEVDHMFTHLKQSAKQAGISIDPFKFFGFPETTIHYHIYRMMKLNEQELQNTWRYRDQDTKGLDRCLSMLNVYKIVVAEKVSLSMENLPVETLELMATAAKQFETNAA